MRKTKLPTSTLDCWMQKPRFRAGVGSQYKELLLSELILAIMAEDDKSVRHLARELKVSKTAIQNLRSGVQTDMKLSNFIKLTGAYGYRLVLEKAGRRIAL